ncbi:cytosolic factor, phosphatidylinositol/phosphatidylcholine transfer protein [Perkinsus olseni]|uniref:Cytosolic factor, phosphatidylinositol/phosphatidylcholine transfer protein n=1 Tax=Perkinsus olseni TaxID=32597 RepID=A0A7J6N768_PEROL|nr:cytosolic factor, phosphatidylinositol/phosphatidylcholine transfer protein [Perkinsus olseni]
MSPRKSRSTLHSNAELPNPVTEEEIIAQLRLDFADEIAECTARNDGECILDDHYIGRFVKARKCVYQNAKEMFGNHLEWRKEFQVDELRLHGFDFPEYEDAKRLYPHGYHGTDKQNRPVYIERTGMVDAGELLKITTFDRLLRYWVQEYEELIAYRLPACGVDKTCTIIDLKGLGLKQFTPQVKNMMQKLAKVANDNYPEVLGTMFVVNAPFIFTAIWKVVSPMVDPITRSKIVVLGSNYKPTLHNVVDPSQLPDFLGGTCTACDDVRGGCMYSNMGPWVAYKKEKEEERRLKSTGDGSPKFEGSAMPSTTRSHSGSFDDFISLVSSEEYRDYVSCCSFTPISRKASEDVVASGKIMNSTTLKPPPSAITESIQSSSVAVEIGTTSHFARASDEDMFSSVAGSALDNSASPIPRSGGTSHRRKKASFTAKWLSCFACHSSAASADIVSPRNKAEGAGQQPST